MDLAVSRNTSNSAGQHSTTDDISKKAFKEAQDHFKSSLALDNKNDIDSFCSTGSLVEFLQWQVEKNQFRGPLSTICRAIRSLGDSLEPYFAAIDNFVSSNPRVSGLVCGAIQIMFKLCQNYATFLEKLAFLLEEIATELLLFGKMGRIGTVAQVVGLTDNGDALTDDDDANRRRVLDSMTQLYTDLLGICEYVCRTFSTGQKKREKLQNIARLLWTPFDQQFKGFIDRLTLHRRIVEAALKEHTMPATQKAQMGLDALIQKFELLASAQERAIKQNGEELLMNHVDRIKSWLSPPMWQTALEEIKAKRMPSTSAWILHHPSYLWWREKSGHLESSRLDNQQSRTLVIHGKPGFGKSTLCATVIDDLFMNFQTVGSQQSKSDIPIAFYLFDKRQPDANNSTSAMRAILTQLLYHSQFKSKLVDLAIVLKDFQGSGQPIATNDEVMVLLQCFLEKHPTINLVFDGLDECTDIDIFLMRLRAITSSIMSRILLCSRPTITLDTNIEIQGEWVGSTQILDLCHQENLEDINAFLRQSLGRLVASHKLVIDGSIDTLASRLTGRTHSMFLWASLMVNYLDSDFLSPQDREDAIWEMSSFEELDHIYVTILNRIYKNCRGNKARQNFRRLFQWVCSSRRPLRLEELRFSLAIDAGSFTKDSRLMRSFKKTLPKITGALLEITEANTVQAIHSSVLDFFLQGTDRDASLQVKCNFDLDTETGQHQVAVDCISYLLYDLPKERLSEGPSGGQTLPMVMKRFPLLHYAAEFWALHAAMAIEAQNSLEIRRGRLAIDALHELLPKLLGQYVRDRLSVTTWIEASWIFQIHPDIRQLADALNVCPTPTVRELKHQVNQFASELERLNHDWGKVLSESPWEIWEPSISAFMRPQFWVSSDQQFVTELDAPPIHTSGSDLENRKTPPWIVIASQSSRDGTEVGWIKVWPSKFFFENLGSSEEPDIQRMSGGWLASYHIKRLADQEMLCHIELQLPESSICGIVKKARENKGQFEFPVAFSYDLRQITLLNYLVRVKPSLESANLPMQDFWSQPLGFDAHHREQTHLVPVSSPWYHVAFSPGAQYIAVLKGPMKPARGMLYKHKEIIIMEDTGDTCNVPHFQYLASEYVRISHFIEKRFFAFHPFQPALAIALLGETNLWFFKPPIRWQRLPFDAPLDSLTFSNCGRYLNGIQVGYVDGVRKEELRMMEIGKYFKDQERIDRRGSAEREKQQLGIGTVSLPIDKRASALQAELDKTLSSESIDFHNSEGHGQVSLLRQLNDLITLEQCRADGSVQFQCLTRLPTSLSLGQSYTTLLKGTNAPDNHLVQLVIHKAMEDMYSHDAKPDMNLPLVISRERDSIPRWTGKHALRVEQFQNGPSSQRRRLN
ncbi:hypothetical protein F5Y16DRAFT_369030 [Xylariaceae sp. FL0255]|nr:hypothetical protein F5Y16DRAFT_369030 [Xylariaceae sp. FL0255]